CAVLGSSDPPGITCMPSCFHFAILQAALIRAVVLAVVSDEPPIGDPAHCRKKNGHNENVDLKACHSSSLPSMSCAVTCRLNPPKSQTKPIKGHHVLATTIEP